MSKKTIMVLEADFHCSFRQAKKLFTVLTPKRLATLHRLKRLGPMTIYALAKNLKRNYSNVYKDIKALKKIGLVELDPERHVFVPWESVEIQFPLTGPKPNIRAKTAI